MQRSSTLCLLFLIISFQINAFTLKPKVIYTSGKELPVEMSLLLQSFQKNLKEDAKNNFLKRLVQLDSVFQRMNKEERFFIIKSELYKLLVRKKSKRRIKESSYKPNSLKEIDVLLSTHKKAYSDFSKWFIRAIQSDLKNLFNSVHMSSFLNNRRNGHKHIQKEVIAIHKKLKLLLPIFEEITSLSPTEFEIRSKSIMQEALSKIYDSSIEFINYSQRNQKIEEAKIDNLVFFRKKEISPLAEVPDSKVNKVLSTLKPDPNYQSPEFLPDPIDDWLPRETPNDPKKVKALPTPNPDYISPEELPIPVDDW